MLNRMILRMWALLAIMLLAGCGSQPAALAPTAAPPTRAPAAPPTAAALPPTAAVPRAPTAEIPTQGGAPTAVAAQAESSAALPSSLTPEGYHVLGRADAPVTLVMYSDFL